MLLCLHKATFDARLPSLRLRCFLRVLIGFVVGLTCVAVLEARKGIIDAAPRHDDNLLLGCAAVLLSCPALLVLAEAG